MAKRLDLTGKNFGRLTVFNFDCVKNGRTYWNCKCDCGNLKSIQGKRLTSGHTQSCGCLVTETSIKNLSNIVKNGRETHGKRHTRLYGIWSDIKKRCNNPKNSHYKYYGGRGICICLEWDEFQPFYDWSVKNGYDDTLTIDRINVNGNYCPDNCRWISSEMQARNKRSNIFIEIEGETKALIEWSEITGINYGTLKSRYHSGKRGKELISKEHGNKRAD